MPRQLYPRERTAVRIVQEDGWVPELVWMLWRKEESCPLSGIELLIV